MYELILDEIESRNLAEATLGELSTLGNTAGRYGGLATVEAASVTSIGQLHLAALQAPLRHALPPQGAQRVLVPGSDDDSP